MFRLLCGKTCVLLLRTTPKVLSTLGGDRRGPCFHTARQASCPSHSVSHTLELMTTPARLRLGTRASALARWQAEWVGRALASQAVSIELVPIATRGDEFHRDPIGNLGEPGVFTKELQRALLDGRIDLAVHSLKDLPTEPVEGLLLAAVPERHSPYDVLLSRGGQRLDQLPQGAVVGTGSLRRRAQLLFIRGDLVMKDIRGNVDTRLGKLEQGEYDALVLAQAGIERLGLGQHVTEVLMPPVMLPAVGQGALGLETRADDEATRGLVARLDHYPTHQAVLAERALLAGLRGGCLAPVAALGRAEGTGLTLLAAVLSHDGARRLEAQNATGVEEAEQLGSRVADELLRQGAADLIQQARDVLS